MSTHPVYCLCWKECQRGDSTHFRALDNQLHHGRCGTERHFNCHHHRRRHQQHCWLASDGCAENVLRCEVIVDGVGWSGKGGGNALECELCAHIADIRAQHPTSILWHRSRRHCGVALPCNSSSHPTYTPVASTIHPPTFVIYYVYTSFDYSVLF